MHKRLSALLLTAAICGCAGTGPAGSSRADDPVKMGDGLYTLGGLGAATDTSGTAVKVRFLQQATAYCAGKGLAMMPGKSTTKDASAGGRASADIQFRCIPK